MSIERISRSCYGQKKNPVGPWMSMRLRPYRSARACPSPMSRIAEDRPPRYGVLAFFCPVRDCCGGPVASPVTVGRGPVPRRCQGLQGTGPRATVVLTFFCPVRDCCGGLVSSPVTVGRGPVPRRCQGLRGTGPRATVCWRFFVPFGIVAVGQ